MGTVRDSSVGVEVKDNKWENKDDGFARGQSVRVRANDRSRGVRRIRVKCKAWANY